MSFDFGFNTEKDKDNNDIKKSSMLKERKFLKTFSVMSR